VSLRDNGCAILLVSAELEEVTSLSDRLLIIHEGKIAAKSIRKSRRWKRSDFE
jgi:simple sugar transport system ATP-binding protein